MCSFWDNTNNVVPGLSQSLAWWYEPITPALR